MGTDPYDLGDLLLRTGCVEILFFVCLAAPADVSSPPGRREFLEGVRNGLGLDGWQLSMLGELADRNREVLNDLVCRLGRRHAVLVAQLEQDRDVDRASRDLAGGLDAVIAATVSVRKLLASYLSTRQLARFHAWAPAGSAGGRDTAWIRAALEAVDWMGERGGGEDVPGSPEAAWEEMVPGAILNTLRRQAAWLRRLRPAPEPLIPRVLWPWLAGRGMPGTVPLHCSLDGLMPLVLLSPGLFESRPAGSFLCRRSR